MATNKKRKLNNILKKKNEIQAKYPNFNFRDMELFHAWQQHIRLTTKQIFLEVDISFCKDENRKKMCSDCNCWKNIVSNIK